MRLSIIVGLYNMQREAPRTLATMAPATQGLDADQYEIVLVDNGSANRLDEDELRSIVPNVRYVHIEAAGPSPTEAINECVASSSGELVTVVIDGARMFSPGIVRTTLRAFEAFDDPFVYAPSMHLGPQLQNDSAYGGYDQSVEDALLETVEWRDDGYRLFEISSITATPERLARPTFESNCFTVHRSTWDRVGGYHHGFADSVGGGLANWELFGRFMCAPDVTPVLLVGEATFHQFHGGASTNKPRAGHPVRGWLREYEAIVGAPFAWPDYEPVLFGRARAEVTRALYDENVVAQVGLARSMSADDQHAAAIEIAEWLVDRWPHDPAKLQLLSEVLEKGERRAEALEAIERAIVIAPTQAELHVTLGITLVGLGRLDDARRAYDESIAQDPLLAEAFFHRGHLELRCDAFERAVKDFERALALEPNIPEHYVQDLSHARRLLARGRSAVVAEPVVVSPPELSIDRMVDEFIESVVDRYKSAVPRRAAVRNAAEGSFSEADLERLATIVGRAAPKRVLVVGGFLGLSTRLVAGATAHLLSSVVTVDPNLRHRVFDRPLDHARAFVRSDRCEFVDGFFGARTAGGSLYDLQHFKPKVGAAAAQLRVDDVPVIGDLGRFDLVLLDADEGSELELARHALERVEQPGLLLVAGDRNAALVELLAALSPAGRVILEHVERGRGFAGIQFVTQ